MRDQVIYLKILPTTDTI